MTTHLGSITPNDGELLARLSSIHLGRSNPSADAPPHLRLVARQPVDATAEILEQLEHEEQTALSQLSPAAVRVYEALVRRRRVPFVSDLKGGLCVACNVRLPSALAGRAVTGKTLAICPSCDRVLIPAPTPQAAPR